jgi:hypothetical protein
MISAAAAGTLTGCGEGPFSLAEMKRWGRKQSIRAAVLRFLLTADLWPVAERGVQLRGVRIIGDLDLHAAKLRCPLSLEYCHLDGKPPVLSFSTAPLLEIRHCHLAGLAAESLVVGADLDLSGSIFGGPIQLIGATIGGQVNGCGARLNGKDDDGDALIADGLKVGGGLFLGDGFIAEGAIRLPGAVVTGQLKCRRIRIKGADQYGRALYADRMTVGGDVIIACALIAKGAIHMAGADITGNLCYEGVGLKGVDSKGNALVADSVKVGNGITLYRVATVTGAIRLPGARVTGRLQCGGVKLKGKDKQHRALLADGTTVSGGAWFGGVRTIDGAIWMGGADITGNFRCEGVRLMGTDDQGRALVADQIKISGSVFLGTSRSPYSRQSIAHGTVSFRSARVGGSMQLKPEELAKGTDTDGKEVVALDLAGAKIADELVWEPDRPVAGQVILEDAHVGQLKDNLERYPNGYWPSARAGLLRLDGFTYDRIVEESKASLSKRLTWIGSPEKKPDSKKWRQGFAAQPYQQLATVYQKSGQDTDARTVSIARRRDLRRYGNLTLGRKAGNWLLGIAIGYGYRTWRAVLALATLYVCAFFVFWWAQHHGQLIIPTMQKTLIPVPTATQCTSTYPCFYPASYAIDTVIPIVNVRQATYWGVNGQGDLGHGLEVFASVGTLLGWALATLTIAGYTGLVRRD